LNILPNLFPDVPFQETTRLTFYCCSYYGYENKKTPQLTYRSEAL